MKPHCKAVYRFAALAIAIAGWLAVTEARASVEFEVRLDPAATRQAVSGRLYVFLSQGLFGEPRDGPDWFSPEPFFAIDVKVFQPGTTRRITDAADGFPNRLSKLRPGPYRAQALLAHNPDHSEQGRAPGNQFSSVVFLNVADGPTKTISLTLDQVVPEKRFPDLAWVKQVRVASPLLSRFLNREVFQEAAVVLPRGYDNHPLRRYPVIYEITGFGGSYWNARYRFQSPVAAGETEFIHVVLDGQCEWGHHVYADSATNGPRGRALVEEFIPEIDRRFRTIAEPRGRLLTGHSSGGWSSLWLQVTHPEFFGGVWSSSPDPVDFRDFQRVDLYAVPPLSLYFDAEGKPRPIARIGRRPVLFYPSFCLMDDVLGRGGQLRSFEAVFSPLDAEGLPKKLWDRRTGRIDPAVAKAWEKYDIRLQLERNWKTLEPLLRGKLHITVGALDTFYLESSVLSLAHTLKRLGSDAEITIVPRADHSTVLTSEYYHRVRRQMTGVVEQGELAPAAR